MDNHEDRVAVTQLGYIGIGVSDLEAWRAFAPELGVQVVGPSAKGTLYLRIDEYHHRFELYPTGEDDLIYAGWEAKDQESMRRIADQIRAHGIEVVDGTPEEAADRKVLGLVKFKDPSGVAMEIYYGPLIDGSPLNLPRSVSGFKALSQGFGHIVLMVDDFAASLAFYTQALGARISDHINFGNASATFMHVNPRHHTLAIGQRPPSISRRMVHFMLEVNTIDDVGFTRQRLIEHGSTVGQFGRHSNDRMFSFYVLSPSGFEIEYGCQGRTIDDEADWVVQHYTIGSSWGHERPWRPSTMKPAPKPTEAA